MIELYLDHVVSFIERFGDGFTNFSVVELSDPIWDHSLQCLSTQMYAPFCDLTGDLKLMKLDRFSGYPTKKQIRQALSTRTSFSYWLFWCNDSGILEMVCSEICNIKAKNKHLLKRWSRWNTLSFTKCQKKKKKTGY